jgi:hypothetical protein
MNSLNLSKYTNKQNGDTLSATEWNGVFNDISGKFEDIESVIINQGILFTVTPKTGPINFPADYYSAEEIIDKVRGYASLNNLDASALLPGIESWPASPGETYQITISGTRYTITYGSNSNNSSSSSSDTHVVFDSTGKHNLTIQTTAED